MSVAFAVSTIASYVALSVTSVAGLQRVRLGPIERYGEVPSGGDRRDRPRVFGMAPVAYLGLGFRRRAMN